MPQSSLSVVAYIVLIAPLLYVSLRAIYNIYLHPLRKFPGPRYWHSTHLVRHFFCIRGDLDWKLKSFHEKYGEVVRFSPDELSFITEDAWREIYARKPYPLVKDPVMYNAIKLGPKGATSIFNADQDQHAKIRKQFAPAFSERAIREQEPIAKEYIDLLMTRLHEVAASGKSTDMVKWINFTTFDMIGDLAMGKAFGCLRDSQYHQWVKNLQDGTKIGPYIRAIASYTDLSRLWRVLAPEHIKNARKQHEQFVRLNAEERLKQGVRHSRRDILSYIVEERSEKDVMSTEEIAANAGFLIIAGSEAAASAMSGILFHLLRNPTAMQRVKAEVRDSFSHEEDIDFASAASRLPFMMACMNEGMRVYPPGPTIPPRRTALGTKTSISGYTVPEWTSVGVHPLSATHSRLNFYQPYDFVPERWLPTTIQDSSSPFYGDRREVLQPFSTGPRSCLGKGLAWNEMRVILARIFWNFDLELCDESWDWDRQKSYTLWDKKPLLCTLKPAARA